MVLALFVLVDKLRQFTEVQFLRILGKKELFPFSKKWHDDYTVCRSLLYTVFVAGSLMLSTGSKVWHMVDAREAFTE